MAPTQLPALTAAPYHYPLPRDQETSEPSTSLPTPFPPTPPLLSHTFFPPPQDQNPYPHTCLPPRSLRSASCTTSLITGPQSPNRTHQRPTQLLCADTRPRKPACAFGARIGFSTSFSSRPLAAQLTQPVHHVWYAHFLLNWVTHTAPLPHVPRSAPP